MKIGLCFATTGGPKIERCLRTFQKMEPDLKPHIVLDVNSGTWKRHPRMNVNGIPILEHKNHGHINGNLNAAIQWMATMDYTHAAIFHDDLIFSPLPQHKYSVSRWFNLPQLEYCSGLSYGHFETFTADIDGRRPSELWQMEPLEHESLWKYLASLPEPIEGNKDYRPPGASFWFRSEGADKVRKWNRLGPTGSIVPVKIWEEVGHFDETAGIFYDQEYPSECFRRKLPPIYAVPNFPWIHLHNQSMNPWGDPPLGGFADTGKAFEKRFGARDNRACGWAGFWGDHWEEEWKDESSLS